MATILDKLRLDGKVAIVTGAGRGLGRAMALALAEAGADIVAAARTLSQLEETAQEVATGFMRKKRRACRKLPYVSQATSDQVSTASQPQ